MDPSPTIDSSEILHALRGLSHDMGANQIMLDHSFRRLKSLIDGDRAESAPPEEVELSLRQVEACMLASKGYLDDLLRLSTSGASELEPVPIDVATVIKQVILEQSPLLLERAVRVQCCGNLPVVWCNPDRLKQVLTNLVRNAALHGCDAARPRITVRACPAPGEDDSMAALRIHDNGPGIDPRRRREIFLPGCRIADTRTEGSGWGLPTARRIAERFGGSLALDLDCATGTAFILALPAATDAIAGDDSLGTAEDGRRWRLQLDAKHHGPLRHGHAQIANDEHRMMNAEGRTID